MNKRTNKRNPIGVTDVNKSDGIILI